MHLKKMLITYLGYELHNIFSNISEAFFEDIEEIRFRIGKPIIINKKNNEFTANIKGELNKDITKGYTPSWREIKKTLELMSGYSLYAFEEELKSGYITLQGGHRVGITGKISLDDGKISTIKNINGLNIRVSHEVKNCCKDILNYLTKPEIMHTMIISPPACGKTTLLRDIIKNISDGVENEFIGKTVGLVDERSEIAGCYMGIAQNDIGIRTDVLDACPKALGMKMLLRTMSPKIIAVDEIGSKEDIFAIEEVINAGVKIICTVHGKNIQDILTKPNLNELINKRFFKRFIVLGYSDKPGKLIGIYDENYSKLR